MKKSLIALAALAAVSVASAQSTVTISGNVSAGMSSLAGVKSIAGLDATNSNLINFQAREDLGGGLTATANVGIRFDVNQNASSTSFGKSTGDQFVELASKTMGAIRIGTFTSYSPAPYSTFATWNAARTDSGIAAPSVNHVRYASPRISGFAINLSSFTPFTAMTVAGASGVIGDKAREHGTQVLLSYVNGPLAVGYMTQEATSAKGTTGVKLSTLDGSYDLKVAKLFVQTWEQKSVAGATDNKGYGISANIPYQAFNFKVGMRKFDDATVSKTVTDRTSFGVTYSLSKRTTVVALLANDKTIATTPVKSTNTYLGVSHRF